MNLVIDTLTILSNGIPGLVIAGVTLILMLLGLIRKDAGLMTSSALLLVPFAFALGSWSGFGLFVRLLPLFPLGSALAISRDDTVFAWALPAPPFGYLIFILFRILASNVG